MLFQLAVKMRRQGAFNMAPVLLWRYFAFCGERFWFSAANQPILTLPGLKTEERNTEASWPSSMQAQLINSQLLGHPYRMLVHKKAYGSNFIAWKHYPEDYTAAAGPKYRVTTSHNG